MWFIPLLYPWIDPVASRFIFVPMSILWHELQVIATESRIKAPTTPEALIQQQSTNRYFETGHASKVCMYWAANIADRETNSDYSSVW